jgi:predicted ATPase
LELLRDRVPSFDEFPYSVPAIRNLDRLLFHPKVTFLVGENGTGKLTLLEAVAVSVGLNPEGGSRNFNFATRASHSTLDDCLRLAKTAGRLARDCYFLRAESFYNVATEIERLDEGTGSLLQAYGGRSLHEQSHWESFFALFQNRFHAPGLYFLDEPEAALSPKRQLEFLAILHDYCKQGSQFVIATHSADDYGLSGRSYLRLEQRRHRGDSLSGNSTLLNHARIPGQPDANSKHAIGRRCLA